MICNGVNAAVAYDEMGTIGKLMFERQRRVWIRNKNCQREEKEWAISLLTQLRVQIGEELADTIIHTH